MEHKAPGKRKSTFDWVNDMGVICKWTELSELLPKDDWYAEWPTTWLKIGWLIVTLAYWQTHWLFERSANLLINLMNV